MARKLENWITSYVEYVENTEPVEIYKTWVAAGTIASCLQRKCWLDWGPHDRYFPNLSIVLVGPAGRSRKGTAMAPGRALLKDLQVPMAAESITRESLIQEVQKAQATKIIPQTGETIEHCSYTINSKELVVFLGYENRTLLMDLTDWFDCDSPWTYRTKLSGTNIIEGICVNLIGAITPETLQLSLPREAIGGGFTSRVIFVYTDTIGKRITRPWLYTLPPNLREDLLHDLQEILDMVGGYKIDESFADLWEEWYPTQDRTAGITLPTLQSYVERRPTHLRKLAMVLNAARTNDMVLTAEDFTTALSLMRATEKDMPKVFEGIGASDLGVTTRQVMGFIALKKKCTFAELYQAFFQDASAEQMGQIIQSIINMGLCRIQKNQLKPSLSIVTWVGSDGDL